MDASGVEITTLESGGWSGQQQDKKEHKERERGLCVAAAGNINRGLTDDKRLTRNMSLERQHDLFGWRD